MMEKLDDSRKVVGTRRLLKALLAGEIAVAYLADDAEMFIRTQIAEACERAGTKLIVVPEMKELGRACGVDVKTAAAGLKKG
jgi:large subunit ribosomal protein L7A